MLKKICYTFFFLSFLSCQQSSNSKTISNTIDFNFDWQFQLKPQNGVTQEDEMQWQTINLPHDWSIQQIANKNLEGCTAYLPGGTGYYKKDFDLKLKKDQKAFLVFDGIYNNSEIDINGKLLESHPYGYAPFFLDISDVIHTDGSTNTINVKVDRTRYADSRWYTGSGIYRNVKLLVKNKLHVPVWGTFITTPSSTDEQANVVIETKLQNDFDTNKMVKVVTRIEDAEGVLIHTLKSDIQIESGALQTLKQTITINAPKLWDINSPYQYKAITIVKENENIMEKVETNFGIRSIRFDVNEGFFLNDINRKIKGVCLHHDAGLVGAAVPKGVWRRRLKKLKAAGCNAIRVSHNPASQEFLDLCDELGFLVQDEFFDEWDNPKDKRLNMNEQSVDHITRGYTEHFQEWAETDLKNTVLAHRNHPSIIQWSIGNEIEWTYPRNGDATGFFNNMDWSGNYFWSQPPHTPKEIKKKLEELPKGNYDIGETALKLANWTRELDTTRYIIANSILPSSSHESGYADALDMIGYSYRRVMYDYGHENYPEIPVMGTENLAQYHEWKAVMERPFIAGTFLWTGIDYLGESNGSWPKKATNSGLLDLAGFEKPSYHMFKSLWTEEPYVAIATQLEEKSIYKTDILDNPIERNEGAWEKALWSWHNVNEHWNYSDEDKTIVEVYSNCESVELFLNDLSLGKKKLSSFEDHIYKWAVPFKSGSLRAVGEKNGKAAQTELKTSDKAVAIKITADKLKMQNDGYDVAHVIAQFIDDNGNPVKTYNHKIEFKVEGEVEILGVDNGAVNNVQPYKSDNLITDKGRALMILQATNKSSKIKVYALSNEIVSKPIFIEIN